MLAALGGVGAAAATLTVARESILERPGIVTYKLVGYKLVTFNLTE